MTFEGSAVFHYLSDSKPTLLQRRKMATYFTIKIYIFPVHLFHKTVCDCAYANQFYLNCQVLKTILHQHPMDFIFLICLQNVFFSADSVSFLCL